MNTAKLIKRLLDWKGDAALYELSSPISYEYFDEDDYIKSETKFVIVSAIIALFSGSETYIFPSDKNGVPLNFLELTGSFRGGLNHQKALNNAGYTLIE